MNKGVFEAGVRKAYQQADALLSGPIAAMQAEHQAEVEVLKVAKDWTTSRIRELEAQLAQYQTASGERNNVG